MNLNFKSNWKNYLLLGLVILCAIFAFTANYYYRQHISSNALAKAEKVLDNPSTSIIKQTVNQAGQHIAETKADDNDIPAAAVITADAGRKRLIDTVREALNLKNVQQIEELTQEVFRLKALVKLHAATDSQGKRTLNYSDKWLHLAYNPIDSTALLGYDASLTSVRFYKKSWIPLIKPLDYIDFYGDDPRITINGVRHFKVIPAPPLFGLSADVKTSVVFPLRIVPSLGLGLRINKWTLEGREYFDSRTNKARPLVSASYKFMDL